MISKLFHSEIPSTVSDRYLAAAAGLLLIGSIAAFFMYIPVLPIIGTVVVLMALMLMFALGLYCGISLEPKVTWKRHQVKSRAGRSARDLEAFKASEASPSLEEEKLDSPVVGDQG